MVSYGDPFGRGVGVRGSGWGRGLKLILTDFDNFIYLESSGATLQNGVVIFKNIQYFWRKQAFYYQIFMASSGGKSGAFPIDDDIGNL